MIASPFDIIRDTLATLHVEERRRDRAEREAVIASWAAAPHGQLVSLPGPNRENRVRAIVIALEQAGLLTVAAEHWSEETLRKLQEDGE